jgi:hypothetical protein
MYCVHKPLTTIGKALGNDVPVVGAGVADHHAQILFDGRDFVLEEIDRSTEITINGKKKRRARLVHGDRVDLGAASSASRCSPSARSLLSARDDETTSPRPQAAAGESARAGRCAQALRLQREAHQPPQRRRAPRGDARRRDRADPRRQGLPAPLIDGSEASAERRTDRPPRPRSLHGQNASPCAPRATCARRPSPTPRASISDSIVRQAIEQARAGDRLRRPRRHHLRQERERHRA